MHEKLVLKSVTKFTGKNLCTNFSFNKVATLRPVILLKKRRWHVCFPVNFAKFLRTTLAAASAIQPGYEM